MWKLDGSDDIMSNYIVIIFTSILDILIVHVRRYCLHICLLNLHYLSLLRLNREKAMATHSSTLAWKILWTEEPGRLRSMGSLRVRHD